MHFNYLKVWFVFSSRLVSMCYNYTFVFALKQNVLDQVKIAIVNCVTYLKFN